MPAKKGMDKQQLRQEEGNLQQKKSDRWRAAACKSSCVYAANVRPHNQRNAQFFG